MQATWSNPSKDRHGNFESRQQGRDRFLPVLRLWPAGHLTADCGAGTRSTTAPVDVVLRLLAADASDRLGWTWEITRDANGKIRGTTMHGRKRVQWWHDGDVEIEDGFTADELLAVHHGRFFLADLLAAEAPEEPEGGGQVGA